jgi:hypothetical protein
MVLVLDGANFESDEVRVAICRRRLCRRPSNRNVCHLGARGPHRLRRFRPVARRIIGTPERTWIRAYRTSSLRLDVLAACGSACSRVGGDCGSDFCGERSLRFAKSLVAAHRSKQCIPICGKRRRACVICSCRWPRLALGHRLVTSLARTKRPNKSLEPTPRLGVLRAHFLRAKFSGNLRGVAHL